MSQAGEVLRHRWEMDPCQRKDSERTKCVRYTPEVSRHGLSPVSAAEQHRKPPWPEADRKEQRPISLPWLPYKRYPQSQMTYAVNDLITRPIIMQGVSKWYIVTNKSVALGQFSMKSLQNYNMIGYILFANDNISQYIIDKDSHQTVKQQYHHCLCLICVTETTDCQVYNNQFGSVVLSTTSSIDWFRIYVFGYLYTNYILNR